MSYEIVGDSIRPFIEEKMKAYDSEVYTEEEFDNFFKKPHKNIVFSSKSGEILAFACILVLTDGYKMCYTYTSKRGKRAYAKGIDYMIARYSPMYFGEGALKFNKIRRLTNE